MLSIRRSVGFLLAIILLTSFGVANAEDDLTKVQQLLDDGKNAEAEATLEKLVGRSPENGRAWYMLGYARHSLGDIGGAIEADLKATEFVSVRADAYYNLACAYGLNNELDLASNALEKAIEAGFVDFDLIGTDTDIAIVRDAGRISFPPSHKYDALKARNGVEIRYKVVLPKNYDANRTYPALVSFAPGGWGPASCDWSLENLWGDSTAESGWIAVHLIAPERGWMTHPSHHALEELLDNIRTEHKIDNNQFHLVGFGNGAQPATTYSGMSGKYFQSLTTVTNRAISRWDDDELKRFSQRRVFLLVGGLDTDTLELNRKASALMREGGSDVSLTVIDDQGPVPGSLLNGGLMRFLDERVRDGKS